METETVFTPQQASTLAVQSVEERSKSRAGLSSNIPGLDTVMLPMKKGDLVVVLGYTGNGKSTVMSYMANYATSQVQTPDEIVIYVSWEQSVEEQTILDISRMSQITSSDLYKGNLSDIQWSFMMQSAIQRATQPLWLIGHSENAGKRRPRLSMTDIANALTYIVDEQGKKPILIVLDYLQRINRADERSIDARIAYMGVVDRIKDMAIAFSTPVILGCQAGRQVLDRKWKQPHIEDGQETSNVEQSADKFISIWMPKTTEAVGSKITYPGTSISYEVDEHLMIIELLKNKWGAAPRTFPIYAEPEIGRLWKRDSSTGMKGI